MHGGRSVLRSDGENEKAGDLRTSIFPRMGAWDPVIPFIHPRFHPTSQPREWTSLVRQRSCHGPQERETERAIRVRVRRTDFCESSIPPGPIRHGDGKRRHLNEHSSATRISRAISFHFVSIHHSHIPPKRGAFGRLGFRLMSYTPEVSVLYTYPRSGIYFVYILSHRASKMLRHVQTTSANPCTRL